MTDGAEGRVEALSGRGSMVSALSRLRRSTQLSSAVPLRNSLIRPRSNSVELLLLEVRNAYDPNSPFIQRWHQVLLVCLLYEVTMLPFLVTFRDSTAPWRTGEFIVVYVCELLFLLDIYVELNTGYYEVGDVTLDTKKARIKYLKSARFALDIVALVPLSVLPVELPVSIVFLEMHKLIRVWRIPRYITQLDDVYAKYFVVLKMFKVLVATLVLSHFLACVRFRFGYDEHQNDNWLPPLPDHEETVQSKYLMSLFWAFGMMTGLFDGELPHTVEGFAFTIFVALCGFVLFTYLCATFFMISKCESGQNEASEARINQFKHLLSFHHVPDELQHQAIEYLKRYYTYTESNDREAMRLLCPSISKDIQVALLKDMVANIVFFQGCNEQFIIAVTSMLEMISLPARIVVFSAGDKGNAMYLVNSGVLHVIMNGVKVSEARKGDFFGEISIFLDRPRSATVVTTTYCTLYKLVRFHVERVLEGYPEYAASIPAKVESRARELFNVESQNTADARSDTMRRMKTFSRLLRKHTTREKKVAPSLTSVVTNAMSKREAIISAHPAAASKGRQEDTNPADPRLLSFQGTAKSTVAPSLSDLTTVHSPIDTAKDLKSQEQPPEPIVSPPVTSDAGEQVRKTSLRLSVVMQMFSAQIPWKSRSETPFWCSLLLRKAIEAESTRRMWWILALQINLIYFWFVVPTRLAFEVLNHPNWYLDAINALMDFGLWVDIYLNFNLSYMEDAEKISDPVCTAKKYLKGHFAFDLFCALPHWVVARVLNLDYFRVLRLLRVWRVPGHFKEVDAFLQLESKQRLLLFGVLLVVLYHIVACLYFSMTYIEGFSSEAEAWIPSNDIYLRTLNKTYYIDENNVTYAMGSAEIVSVGLTQYFRSLYYACYVLTALGKPIEPANDTQFRAALVFMLSGFFITAIVVDNVQKRFTASAFEQKEFFSTRSRIQIFLVRQNAPLAIHKRVSAFLDFWWSSHRGAIIGSLLEELPAKIKNDIMMSICKPALQTLALMVGVRPVLNELEQVLIENVKFILYGQGEVVYRQGDFAGGIFFLLEGHVCIITNGGAPRSVPQGSFFGTAALHLDDNAASYSERVSAISGCVVVFVSREHLELMHTTFPSLSESLHALEKRFLDPKLLKASEMTTATMTSSDHFFSGLLDRVFDPDSSQMLVWEAWVFVTMTTQWVLVIFIICFAPASYGVIDIVIVLIEVVFVIDMYVRFHLGYHEFGNKVMDLRLIRNNYFRSRAFMVDAVALLPLFTINWGLASAGQPRLEILNFNKLARLIKVPAQFAALENKHLKFTLELRLFKLVYYTFLLSHTLGCFWFDYRSHASHIHSALDENDPSQDERWLPPESLLGEGSTLQYFSSLFWSFSIMSATHTGELPKTISQCIFNITTLTVGFFLFAYVVGNFSDIIELMDAENREFYAKLSSFRHLLAHFNLPAPIQERFKAYFFFKRFHSITQEHLLESCLPPSLLTDIRMVHLQPMIMKVSFLSDMNGSVTRMLVSHFSQVMIVKDEFVYKFGEEGSDMYFVFAGILDTLLPREEPKPEAPTHDRRRSRLLHGKPSVAPSSPTKKVTIAPLLSTHKIHPRPQTEKASIKLNINELSKLNQIGAGDYFGENALFKMDSVRNAFVLAQSTCILYKLSRNSLETVFIRYPDWKLKVLRIMKLQQEQMRLNHIAKAEIQNSVTSTMTPEDHMNADAAKMEEALRSARYKRSATISRIEPASTSRVRSAPTLTREAIKRSFKRFCHTPEVLSVLFHGAPAQSVYHLIWLHVIIFATIFVSIVVPYRISFDSMEHAGWLAVLFREMETLCELVYLADIWVNWRLQQSSESVDLYEQDHRQSYKNEWLVWDILAVFPLDYLLSSFSINPLYRINRCLKLRNLVHYMNEVNRRSIHKVMHRLRTASVLYILLMYWSACTYYAIAVYDHFGDEWDAWLPDASLAEPATGKRTLRLLRGCFFATTSFLKKGRTFLPDTTFHYGFCIITTFIGLLTMAFMIGEFANLFISYIGNEVEYRKNHIAVELYLGRWKISGELKTRTQAFLSSLWSSHRGVDYQSFLESVPESIRTESILNIAQEPLHSFANDLFKPLALCDEQNAANKLMHDIAQHLKFEGYPRGENVLVEGSITKSMYFVVRGHLLSTSRAHPDLTRGASFSKGSYFGEKGLLDYSVSLFSVRTLRACDLLSLSSDALQRVLENHSISNLAYEIATKAMRIIRSPGRVASHGITTETEWGDALLEAIRQKRTEVDEGNIDCDNGNRRNSLRLTDALEGEAEAARARQSALKLINAHFSMTRAVDAFSAFRPLLQLIVPNGLLHSFKGPRVGRLSGVGGSDAARARAGWSKQQMAALPIIARLFRKNSAISPTPTASFSSNGSNGPKQGAVTPAEAEVVLPQREQREGDASALPLVEGVPSMNGSTSRTLPFNRSSLTLLLPNEAQRPPASPQEKSAKSHREA
ncbi:hypothetical protein BBJ28_00009922 [Nothophytophthora sp. Chile5]|nr:hypothetical protein BBJ28_00009922 [Nothophytophthora sp. Chile5]